MAMPQPFRPVPAPPGSRPPAAGAGSGPIADDDFAAPADGHTGHPAVDAAVEAVRNAAGLPPADQIAQYEAAHSTLQETLATIDQA
jgi:hypothetical protein